ncbi:hypothetical protein ABTL37_19280, partial [Acinetobacter baumannii]
MTAEHSSHAVTGSVPHGPVDPSNPFSPAEVAAFTKDDVDAAGNIVKLILSIFLAGIGLYLVV